MALASAFKPGLNQFGPRALATGIMSGSRTTPTGSWQDVSLTQYAPSIWANWDNTASTEMSQINTLEQQLGGNIPPALQGARSMLQKEMYNRQHGIGDQGNAAASVQKARTAYYTALQSYQRQNQANTSLGQTGNNAIPQSFYAPGTTTAQANAGNQATAAGSGGTLPSWLTNMATSGPPQDPANVSADVQGGTVRGGTDLLTGADLSSSIPAESQGSALTTGQGAVGGMGLPKMNLDPLAQGREPAPVTEGFDRTMFGGVDPGIMKTGNTELDTTLMRLATGGSADAEAMTAMATASFVAALGADPDKLSATQEQYLSQMNKNIAAATAKYLDYAASEFKLKGTYPGSQVVDFSARTAAKMAGDMMAMELKYRGDIGQENRALLDSARGQAASFATALMNGDQNKMSTILSASRDSLDRRLNEKQLQATYDIQRENAMLGRDKFTEEQRQALRSEGFKEYEIALAEQQQGWVQAYEEFKYVADHNLAVRNTDIVERVQMGELDLNEIKNKFNMGFSERVQEFTEELGLRDAAYKEEELDYMWDRMQKEFGLNLNKFALEKWATTGQFSLDVLNSQRSFDLSVAAEENSWLKSMAGLQLQEVLGMSELELKDILHGQDIGMQEDIRLTEVALKLMGFDFQSEENRAERELLRWQIEKKYEEEGNARKSSFFSQIVKSAVGAGVGFVTGGGLPGAAMGLANSFGMSMPSGSTGGSGAGGANPGGYFGNSAFNLGGN